MLSLAPAIAAVNILWPHNSHLAAENSEREILGPDGTGAQSHDQTATAHSPVPQVGASACTANFIFIVVALRDMSASDLSRDCKSSPTLTRNSSKPYSHFQALLLLVNQASSTLTRNSSKPYSHLQALLLLVNRASSTLTRKSIKPSSHSSHAVSSQSNHLLTHSPPANARRESFDPAGYINEMCLTVHKVIVRGMWVVVVTMTMTLEAV